MSIIHALGYVVVEGPVAQWREFATELLGAQVAPSSTDEELRLRFDDRAFRLVVREGPARGPESLRALGLEVANAPALEELLAVLDRHGISHTDDPETAEARQVRRLVAFADPDGNRLEAYYGQASDHHAFVSPTGVRFVTGEMGIGHTFLTSADADRAYRFWTEVMGFRLSDTIDFGFADGIFMHCNPRHHSVAVAAFPNTPAGIGHLMLEVERLESVGRALDVVDRRPGSLSLTIGEHTNDKMTSFYVRSPSVFEIEYGWDGLLIDDDEWTVGHHLSISTWGHHFQRPADDPSADPQVAAESGAAPTA